MQDYGPIADPAGIVARPAHYVGADGLEAITVIEDWGLGFQAGNVVKYILRHQAKGRPIDDLAKARQYVRYAALRLHQTDQLPDWTIDGPGRHTVRDVAEAFALSDTLRDALTSLRIAVDVPALARSQLANCDRALDREIEALRARGGA